MTAQLDKKVIKVKGNWLLRCIALLFSLVLLLVLAVQMGAWGGFFWLNTASGQAWLEKQFTTAAQDTGYQIKAQQLYMRGFGHFVVGKLEVSDKDGILLNASNIDVAVSLASLTARNLSLSVYGKNAILHRLPAGEVSAVDTPLLPLVPMLLPDIYFNKIVIASFDVGDLILEPAIMGERVSLSPHLQAQAVINGNRISLSGDASIKNATMFYLPKTLLFKVNFDTNTAQLELETFKAGGDLYSVDVAGNTGLGSEGTIDLAVRANTKQLEQLMGVDFAGTVEADLKLSGKTIAPVADLEAITRLETAAKRGLDDIHLSAHADDILSALIGKINVTSAYKEKPIALSTDVSYDQNLLRLTSLRADAPDVTVEGAVDLDTQTMLATGKMKAAGLIDTYRDLLNMDIGGSGDVVIDLSATNSVQAAQIKGNVKNLYYDDIKLAAATIDVSMPDVMTFWPEQLALTLQSLQMPDVMLDDATANIKRLAADKYQLTLDVNGKTSVISFKLDGSSDVTGKTIDDVAFSNIDMNVSSGKTGMVHVKGSALPANIALSFDSQNITLSSLPIELPEQAQDMRLNISGAIMGVLSAPIITAETQVSSTRKRADFPALSLVLKSRYEGQKFNLDLVGSGEGVRVLTGQAVLPLSLSLKPFSFSMAEPLPLDTKLDAELDIAPLAKFFAPADMTVGGKMVSHVQINGTSKSPVITGNATLSDGIFSQNASGINLLNIALKAAFDDSKLVVSSLNATDSGKGRVTGKGTVSLTPTREANIELHMKDLSPFSGSAYAKGYISADLTMGGTAKAYMVKGKVTTNRLDVNIPERFSSDIPKLNIVNDKAEQGTAPDMLKTIGLDVKFIAENQVFVRGWGLDAEFGGDLDINGTAYEPLINGSLESKRGRYEEFGKRFTISRANLRFQGAVPPSPYLDILAETKTKDITAQITLSGPVVKPSIALSSVPALPQDEVMSRILFNNEMNKISPWQGVQLARTLRRFSGKGGDGFDPLSEIRGATGLDDLKVEMNDEGGATVGAGKYITDKVYLQVEAGTGKKGSATKLEIELSPQIKLESRVGQDAQGGAGIFWQKDY